MEDDRIVDLCWERSESAVAETDAKYGRYLHSISYHIVSDREDARECVNDTYHDAWNAMPPHRPAMLSAFLGKITRRISIDHWRKKHAGKRGQGEIPLVLDELQECVSGKESVENEILHQELTALLGQFLRQLPATERRVFLCRYWYLDSVKSIAHRFGFSQSKVASMLYRTRGKLRTLLEQEDYL